MNQIFSEKMLIVSPVRNESAHIGKTLESVTGQTLLPMEWVIVDDGSTDSTAEIVAEYERKFPWITFVRKTDRGYAEPGRGVMEAFYFGYERRKSADFDFIVKLDGDLSFGKQYFENIMKEFHKDPRLGIAGGYCYITENGGLPREDHPEFHVRGTNKFYRAACWHDIAGLVRHLGWDTIDEIKAQYSGWQTCSFDFEKVMHYKVTGYNTGSFRWTVKLGQSDFYSGYHPLFLIAKAIKRSIQRPYFTGMIGILYGYFRCILRNEKRVAEPEIVNFLQREQLRTLFLRSSLWYNPNRTLREVPGE